MRGGRRWRLSWQQYEQYVRILTASCNLPCRLYERRKKRRLSWQQYGQYVGLLTTLCVFPCRLYERRKKMEAKLAAVRAAAEHPMDPATGRPLFQPAIGRAPHYHRNQHGLPVGEYLYGMR